MSYRRAVEPILAARAERGRDIPVLVWRPARTLLAIASGPLGGGIGERGWVINATVPMSYDRDDPDAHLMDMAHGLGLSGLGVGLLTGVDVAEVRREEDGGATVWATVGLGAPTWAAEPGRGPLPERAVRVGTINIVVHAPVRLSEAALVNAVATVTEAKVQALRDLGVAGTGTATDAVCVLCPTGGPAEQYGGPCSTWGARLARATHRAVSTAGAADLAGGIPWSRRREG